MATIREVENAVKALVVQAVYPTGTSNPPVAGTFVKIRVGYPISEKLDAEVLAGTSMVSIFPIGNSDKNTTRFMQYWNLVSLDTATLTATVAANQITIGGTVGTPQAVLITYNGINYGYEVLISDTTSTIAAALAALIPTATAVANVITIAGQIDSLRAVVVVSGLAALEVKRQSKLFYVSVYTPNPDFRDAIADAIDVVLGQAKRLNFPDTTQALITYKGANEQDTFEKNIIYQRDLVYTIEYPTMMYDTYTTIESIHADIEVTPNL